MPELFDRTEEILCQAIARKGMTRKDAAREAGISITTANKKVGLPHVLARLQELAKEREADYSDQEKERLREIAVANNSPYDPDHPLFTEVMVKVEDLSVDFFINQILETAVKARNANQFGPANQAFKMLAEIMGLFKDPTANKTTEKETEEKPTITLEQLTEALNKRENKELIDLTGKENLPILRE